MIPQASSPGTRVSGLEDKDKMNIKAQESSEDDSENEHSIDQEDL